MEEPSNQELLDRLNTLLSGKKLEEVRAPRSDELLLIFEDGTRFFVETKGFEGLSVT
jgi:hypothetical protein|tara:strand:- start:141 stop:311 length:171 start_codon:yes stop_codon:yes gene_type:complete